MSSRRRSLFVRGAALLLLPAVVAAAPAPSREARGRPCQPLVSWFAVPSPADVSAVPNATKEGTVQAKAPVQPRGLVQRRLPTPVSGPLLEAARWEVTAVGAGWLGSLATTWVNRTDGPLAVLPRIDVSTLDVFEATLVRADGTREPIPPARPRERNAASHDARSLLPGERVGIEVALRGSLRAGSDRFELELPSILGNCPPGDVTASLEARVEVPTGGKLVDGDREHGFVASSTREGLVLDLVPGVPIDERPLHAAWTPARTDEAVAIARSRPLREGGHEVTLMVAAPTQHEVGPIEPRQVHPRRVADLYAGRPLVLRAVLGAPPPPDIRIVGSTAAGERAYDVRVDVETRGGAGRR